MKKIQVFCLAVLFVSMTAQADSIIRVKCDDKDAGAEVFLDGKSVGNCPLDVPVQKEGQVKLSARKMVNADYEQLFEKWLNMVDGVPQRVQLVMSAAQITADAARRKLVAEANAQLYQAERGDADAMEAVAKLYDIGRGIEMDGAKAKAWRVKAEESRARIALVRAEIGNVDAMDNIAERYQTGKGVAQDAAKAQIWRDKATEAKQVAKLAAEAAERERVAQEKARIKEQKLNNTPFFKYLRELVETNKNEDAFGLSTVFVTGGPIMLVSDIISAPIVTSQRQFIQMDAYYRPSTWAKPDSMIARAAKQRDAASAPMLVANGQ